MTIKIADTCVFCPTCKAAAGEPCHSIARGASTFALVEPHAARRKAAAAERGRLDERGRMARGAYRAARRGPPPEAPQLSPGILATDVRCPKCDAAPGEFCTLPGPGGHTRSPHEERIKAAAAFRERRDLCDALRRLVEVSEVQGDDGLTPSGKRWAINAREHATELLRKVGG